jgi:hypothetical protein
MNSSTHLNTLRRGSRFLAWLCLLAAIAWPLAEAAWMMWRPALELCLELSVAPAAGGNMPLKLWQRMLLAALALVPALAASLGLWALNRCFRLFAIGDFFSVRTVRSLRRCAGWTFCSVALSLVTQPLASLVLTAHFPETGGEHHLTFAISSGNFQTLLIAGSFWVISGAMAEAGRLADENAQFV